MNVVVSVTKRFKFSAAHFLPDDPGPCRNVHGHTYEVEVTAQGPVGEDGMVVHFDELKAAWALLEPLLDHQTLNESLPPAACPPTTENVAVWLLDRFRAYQPAVRAVRLWEGPGSFAEARRR